MCIFCSIFANCFKQIEIKLGNHYNDNNIRVILDFQFILKWERTVIMKKAVGFLLALAMMTALVLVPLSVAAQETESPFLLWGAETLDGKVVDVNSTSSVVNDPVKEGNAAVKFEYADSVVAGVFKGYSTFKFYEPVDLSNFTTISVDIYIGGKDLTGIPNQCFQINFLGPDNNDNGIDHSNLTLFFGTDSGTGWRTVTFGLNSDEGAAAGTKWNNIHGFRIAYMCYGYNDSVNPETQEPVKGCKEAVDGAWLVFDNITLSGRSNINKPDPEIKWTEPVEPPPEETPFTIIDCDTLLGWKDPGNNANVMLETEIKQEGEGAVKQTYPTERVDGTIVGYNSINFYEPVDLSNFTTCSVDVYIGGNDLTGLADQCLQVNFAAPGKEDGFNHSNINLQNAENGTGWRTITFELKETPDVEASWDNIGAMRIGYMDYSKGKGNGTFLIYDNIRLSGRRDAAKADPEVIFTAPVGEKECVILDCDDDPTDWLTSGEVVLSLNTEDKTQGDASIKFYPANPIADNTLVVYNFEDPIDCTNFRLLRVDVYVAETGSPVAEGLQINMATGRQDGYNHMWALNNVTPGWHTVEFPLEDGFIEGSGVDLAAIDTIRFWWLNYNYYHDKPGQYFLIDNVRLAGKIDESLPDPVTPKHPVTGKVLAGTTGVDLEGIRLKMHRVNDKGEVANAAFASATLDANGNYKFNKLKDGKYAIRITAEEGKYDFVEKVITVNGEAVTVEDITLTYTAPPVDETVYGDVNGDGDIDSLDALIVLQHIVGNKIEDEKHLAAADAYKDGEIDSNDALSILQFSVGIVKELPEIPKG